MTDQLNQTLVEPVSRLSYRIRSSVATEMAPCLLLLHGVGANEAGFIDLARQIDPRVTVVLARGPLALGPSQFAWFQVAFTQSGPRINPEQAEHARRTLTTFIEQLPLLHGVDPARICIAGFSQGGIMSASVGLTAPEKVAGLAILSGRILPEVLPLVQPGLALAKVHAFISHGVQDSKLGIDFAHQAKQVLNGFGVPLEYHEYPADHVLDMAMIGDFTQWLDGLLIQPNPTSR